MTTYLLTVAILLGLMSLSDDFELVHGMQYSEHVLESVEFKVMCQDGRENKVHGCAVTSILNRTCDIYLPLNYTKVTLVHERRTCHGWRHKGDRVDIQRTPNERTGKWATDWYLPTETAKLIDRVNTEAREAPLD